MSKLRPGILEIPSTRIQREKTKPLDDPQLFWPSIENGSPPKCDDKPHFPDMYQVELRYRQGRYNSTSVPRIDLKLTSFTSAVELSLEWVLVLDPHFDEFGVNALAPALSLSHANDIRLLTGGGQQDQEGMRKILEEFRNMNSQINGTAEVHWNIGLDKRSFPYLHDRFAVIDNALWHFGSTVGGGHRGLTAASGPWPEADARAKQFFNECWRILRA